MDDYSQIASLTATVPTPDSNSQKFYPVNRMFNRQVCASLSQVLPKKCPKTFQIVTLKNKTKIDSRIQNNTHFENVSTKKDHLRESVEVGQKRQSTLVE